MKELSIEEKAKAYDEAFDRARKLKENPTSVFYEYTPSEGDTVADYIFPELKESEDEKMLKQLRDFFKNHIDSVYEEIDDNNDVLSWLEKQGEHKPADKEYTFKAIPRLLGMIPPTDRAKSYCQKLIDSLEQEGYSTDAKIVRDCLKQMNGEKVAMATMDEQKPAWSEEDELIVAKILYICNDFERSFESSPSSMKVIKEDVDKIDNWLKSLRPHNTWKPSDEQMNTLEYYMHTLVCNEHKEILFGLYSDLKKLREG